MGIPWGIVTDDPMGPEAVFVQAWMRHATDLVTRPFQVLRDDVLWGFKRRTVRMPDGTWQVDVTKSDGKAERQQVDALRTGDGTYDMFDQLLDGEEILVPYRTAPRKIDRLGSPLHGKREMSIADVLALLRMRESTWKTTPPADPNVRRVAKELATACRLAKKLHMFVQICF